MKKYIFGNWKMYLTLQESQELARVIAELSLPKDFEVALFANPLAFAAVEPLIKETDIGIGAQNVAWVPKGAYTGATSAALYCEAGARFALIGHSERRYIFGETNADVRKKVDAAIDAGLIPVVCVGETKEDKANNTRQIKLQEQLKAIFEGLEMDAPLFVAYEPVWAISQSGVGEACLPADVHDIHLWMKSEIKKYTSREVPLLYGGSVNSENIVSYLTQKSVDGVLVGSASTKSEFWKSLETLVLS